MPINFFNQNVNNTQAIQDDKKSMFNVQQQPQVAFINSVWDNFGGSQGTEASFNA